MAQKYIETVISGKFVKYIINKKIATSLDTLKEIV